jgi:hypothetical protein
MFGEQIGPFFDDKNFPVPPVQRERQKWPKWS